MPTTPATPRYVELLRWNAWRISGPRTPYAVKSKRSAALRPMRSKTGLRPTSPTVASHVQQRTEPSGQDGEDEDKSQAATEERQRRSYPSWIQESKPAESLD